MNQSCSPINIQIRPEEDFMQENPIIIQALEECWNREIERLLVQLPEEKHIFSPEFERKMQWLTQGKIANTGFVNTNPVVFNALGRSLNMEAELDTSRADEREFRQEVRRTAKLGETFKELFFMDSTIADAFDKAIEQEIDRIPILQHKFSPAFERKIERAIRRYNQKPGPGILQTLEKAMTKEARRITNVKFVFSTTFERKADQLIRYIIEPKYSTQKHVKIIELLEGIINNSIRMHALADHVFSPEFERRINQIIYGQSGQKNPMLVHAIEDAMNRDIKEVPIQPFAFSEEFLQKPFQHSMLAKSPVLVKKRAFALVATFIFIFTTVLSVGAVRETLAGWAMNVYNTFSTILFENDPGYASPGALEYILAPTWLPEGFDLEDEEIALDFAHIRITYYYGDDKPIVLRQFAILARGNFWDTEDVDEINEVMVGSYEGLSFYRKGEHFLAWTGSQYGFRINGPVSEAELIRIAESLQEK